MSEAASHLATLGGCMKWKIFIRKRVGGKELLTKGKKCLFLEEDIFWGERKAKVFIIQVISSLYGNGEDSYNRLLVLNQKILDWFIKITFLGEIQTTVRSELGQILKPDWAFSMNDAILGL